MATLLGRLEAGHVPFVTSPPHERLGSKGWGTLPQLHLYAQPGSLLLSCSLYFLVTRIQPARERVWRATEALPRGACDSLMYSATT